MRLFFAIALEGALRGAAEALLAQLRAAPHADAVRWVRPEGLHVTLRFLGEVAAERVPPLARAVAAEVAVRPAFALGLGSVEGFPTRRRPRVVACQVAPHQPVADLAAAVARGAAREGFAPEARAFHPHLTLGRVRRGHALALPAVAAPGAAQMCVRQAVLFRSELQSGGARYSPLERFALAGGSSAAPEFT